MYYNRDMLEGAGVVSPPKYWTDFIDLAGNVTRKGQAQNIIKSAVSFGEFSNVAHAKDLFASMLLQKGMPIVSRTDTSYAGRLSDNLGQTVPPTESTLEFYTDFSNPTKNVYSWNKGFPYSRDAFIVGDLATYFGYASEILNIQSKNPNLNYDVVKLPQTKDSTIQATFGKLWAIAISKSSKNAATAYVAATSMTSADFASKISKAVGLPPVRRDLLVNKPATPFYSSVFYDSALISRAWLDPFSITTDQIFKNMIEDVSSGRSSVNSSSRRAGDEINFLFKTQ